MIKQYSPDIIEHPVARPLREVLPIVLYRGRRIKNSTNMMPIIVNSDDVLALAVPLLE